MASDALFFVRSCGSPDRFGAAADTNTKPSMRICVFSIADAESAKFHHRSANAYCCWASVGDLRSMSASCLTAGSPRHQHWNAVIPISFEEAKKLSDLQACIGSADLYPRRVPTNIEFFVGGCRRLDAVNMSVRLRRKGGVVTQTSLGGGRIAQLNCNVVSIRREGLIDQWIDLDDEILRSSVCTVFTATAPIEISSSMRRSDSSGRSDRPSQTHPANLRCGRGIRCQC